MRPSIIGPFLLCLLTGDLAVRTAAQTTGDSFLTGGETGGTGTRLPSVTSGTTGVTPCTECFVVTPTVGYAAADPRNATLFVLTVTTDRPVIRSAFRFGYYVTDPHQTVWITGSQSEPFAGVTLPLMQPAVVNVTLVARVRLRDDPMGPPVSTLDLTFEARVVLVSLLGSSEAVVDDELNFLVTETIRGSGLLPNLVDSFVRSALTINSAIQSDPKYNRTRQDYYREQLLLVLNHLIPENSSILLGKAPLLASAGAQVLSVDHLGLVVQDTGITYHSRLITESFDERLELPGDFANSSLDALSHIGASYIGTLEAADPELANYTYIPPDFMRTLKELFELFEQPQRCGDEARAGSRSVHMATQAIEPGVGNVTIEVGGASVLLLNASLLPNGCSQLRLAVLDFDLQPSALTYGDDDGGEQGGGEQGGGERNETGDFRAASPVVSTGLQPFTPIPGGFYITLPRIPGSSDNALCTYRRNVTQSWRADDSCLLVAQTAESFTCRCMHLSEFRVVSRQSVAAPQTPGALTASTEDEALVPLAVGLSVGLFLLLVGLLALALLLARSRRHKSSLLRRSSDGSSLSESSPSHSFTWQMFDEVAIQESFPDSGIRPDPRGNHRALALGVTPVALWALDVTSTQLLSGEARLRWTELKPHPNICQLFGMYASGELVYAVMEYIPQTLDSLLRTTAKSDEEAITTEVAIAMAQDIAAAVGFLHMHDILHQSLCASQLLVKPEGNRFMVKLHGFGSSPRQKIRRQLDDDPAVRWSAPEVVTNRRYSNASDAWSFAVVLHEILSRGRRPYEDLTSDADVVKAVNTKGRRLPMVDGCPPDLYKLMLRCWDQAPAKRPSFDEIKEVLSGLLPKDSPSATRRTPSPGAYDDSSATAATGPAPYAVETLPDTASEGSNSVRSPTSLREIGDYDSVASETYQASPVIEGRDASSSPRRRGSPRAQQQLQPKPPQAELAYTIEAQLGDADRPTANGPYVLSPSMSQSTGLELTPAAQASVEAPYTLAEIRVQPNEDSENPHTSSIPLGGLSPAMRQSEDALLPSGAAASDSDASGSDSDLEFERRMAVRL